MNVHQYMGVLQHIERTIDETKPGSSLEAMQAEYAADVLEFFPEQNLHEKILFIGKILARPKLKAETHQRLYNKFDRIGKRYLKENPIDALSCVSDAIETVSKVAHVNYSMHKVYEDMCEEIFDSNPSTVLYLLACSCRQFGMNQECKKVFYENFFKYAELGMLSVPEKVEEAVSAVATFTQSAEEITEHLKYKNEDLCKLTDRVIRRKFPNYKIA